MVGSSKWHCEFFRKRRLDKSYGKLLRRSIVSYEHLGNFLVRLFIPFPLVAANIIFSRVATFHAFLSPDVIDTLEHVSPLRSSGTKKDRSRMRYFTSHRMLKSLEINQLEKVIVDAFFLIFSLSLSSACRFIFPSNFLHVNEKTRETILKASWVRGRTMIFFDGTRPHAALNPRRITPTLSSVDRDARVVRLNVHPCHWLTRTYASCKFRIPRQWGRHAAIQSVFSIGY